MRSQVMGYGRYFDKLQAMMIGNVAPDLMMVGANYYDEWCERGVLLDVTEDFVSLQEMGEIMPVPRKAVEREGRVYGLPVNITGVVTCINVSAFREAGIPIPDDGRISWREIFELCLNCRLVTGIQMREPITPWSCCILSFLLAGKSGPI